MQMWCNGSIADFQSVGEGSNPFICFYMGRSYDWYSIGDFQSPDASSSLARSAKNKIWVVGRMVKLQGFQS